MALVLLLIAGKVTAAQFMVDGPAGSGEFGSSVTTLPNGNIVVTDPGFDAPGAITDVGAVHLYRPDGSLISTLRGGSAGDRVGAFLVVVLANGNFVVRSPYWDNGSVVDAGAVTFGSGTSGIEGVVSVENSLVGSSANDRVGLHAFGPNPLVLPNGNYVVQSPDWDNGAVVDAGAVTFGSGISGVSGIVSAANSLIGTSSNDRIGAVPFNAGLVRLSNGSYVVRSPDWDNGAVANAGAVTFGSGTSGISGPVSAANSLVGSSADDQLGAFPVIALANGNFVIQSPWWNNGEVGHVGAATFASGADGISGVISSANSLIGSSADDLVGMVTALANGNYVVHSRYWDNGAVVDAGAATFGSGASGIVGVVSQANSLVGSSEADAVASLGVTALTNGNYVVNSPFWDNGVDFDAGAATFGSGTSGLSGIVSAANSLVGAVGGESISSSGTTALANGNYVVRSPGWRNGAFASAGAVTFGSGASGITGLITAANSLVGSATSDNVGWAGVIALANGNYAVQTPFWDNGKAVDAGAVTFGSGSSGVSGVVSPANSLVGTSTADLVGGYGNYSVIALANGNYVVQSPAWDNGAIVDAGAVTFGPGDSGISGEVSAANSLVGNSTGDGLDGGVTALAGGNFVAFRPAWDNGIVVDAGAVTFGSGTSGISGVVSPFNSLVGGSPGDGLGSSGVTALTNGNYVVKSPSWRNGALAYAGATTLGLPDGSIVGPLTATHSVLGTVANQGQRHVFSYDASRNQLAVGQPASNRVVLHRTGSATTTAIVSATPDPSHVGDPVSFSATVSAAPDAPGDGKVTFSASTGETCVDTTPTPISATSAGFSCAIVFNNEGMSSVSAEYTGSVLHAYSGSTAQSHTTNPASLFANGFETP